MHEAMQYDPIQGQSHEPLKVGYPSIFKSCLLRYLKWELATDHWFLNWGTISKFDRAGCLTFVLVVVSRDCELGRNVSCEELTVSPARGYFILYHITSITWYQEYCGKHIESIIIVNRMQLGVFQLLSRYSWWFKLFKALFKDYFHITDTVAADHQMHLWIVLQSAYLHTSVNDPAILVVFELVGKSPDTVGDDSGPASDVGCGWGFIPLFKRNVKSVDVSDSAASPATRY